MIIKICGCLRSTMVLFPSPPSLPKAKEFGPLECMLPHLTTIYIFNSFILHVGKRLILFRN